MAHCFRVSVYPTYTVHACWGAHGHNLQNVIQLATRSVDYRGQRTQHSADFPSRHKYYFFSRKVVQYGTDDMILSRQLEQATYKK
jgi:hypothetical protein